MLDFNAGEILLLVVIAVIIFGPEKLPDLARKAARVLNYLRGIANDARGQLREQVPELADLSLADLNPRAIGARLLGPDTAQELAETGRNTVREFTETRQSTAQELAAARDSAVHAVTDPPSGSAPRTSEDGDPLPATVDAPPRVVAFDPEAT